MTNITDKIIDNFEQRIGSSLPNDYRNYLKIYNGEKPEKTYFHVSNEIGDSRVHLLYGFSQPNYKDIEWKYSNFRDFENMQNFLAIGSDEGGNQIALDLTDNKIHFIGMDQALDINICIANSFTDFFNNLQTPPYRDRLDEFLKTGSLGDLKKMIETDKSIINQRDELGSSLLESAVINIRPDFVEYLIPFFKKEDIEIALNTAIRNAEFFNGYDAIISSLKNKLNS